ncbi:helix-turn-helix domain-containing protein [Nocardioides zeae]|uniref:Helix-turn-helix domain-containing protein n=1 Tax=Nocardioides imazamoxiresistens TaxID=3231893 RepID=A0ABU3PYT1_9ACTN|nr:GAF domain-containing protein [Nocardioides zeae]MDT9594401.1 helix-turn-helix domain-containing protein [Nocardioides zeae]
METPGRSPERHAPRTDHAVGSPATTAPGRLRASWQRSHDYGVPADEVQPVFAGTSEQESLFVECGREVLADLHRTLAAEPVSLMLTDADGLVINRLSGDVELLRALDRVHLAPGFSYAERDAGTNGLGLALADRQPSLVRAEEHYSLSLSGYTCAAAPVLDPLSGRLEGSVNLTTWSRSSHELLLALAQSAASSTAALMLARAHGRRGRPAPRGTVFRVEPPRLEPGSGRLDDLSGAWRDSLAQAAAALAAEHVLVVVGEPGSGRTTLAAQAQRSRRGRDRILAASVPEPHDVGAWLALWTPELAKADTSVVVRDVDALPAWAAERLVTMFAAGTPVAVTVEQYADLPAAIGARPHAVVQVPALRERPDDVLPLAHHVARRVRGREVPLSPAAAAALRAYAWPGNVRELAEVVRDAVVRVDVVDVQHLPPHVLSSPGRRLSRIESFERDEIVRVLTTPGITMADAASRLGMSRATVYRKVAQYDIRVPRHP